MKNIFKKLNITYSKDLHFLKSKIKKKVIKSWEKNQDPANRWLSFYCQDDMIDQRHPQMELRYINGILKYGLFALEDIGTHRFIGEYTGTVRKQTLKMLFTNFYCVEYPVGFQSARRWVIDAEKKGNFTRFINHSKTPNVEMKSALFDDGLMHVIFLAKRRIQKQEQLTMNYGRRFWLQSLKKPTY